MLTYRIDRRRHHPDNENWERVYERDLLAGVDIADEHCTDVVAAAAAYADICGAGRPEYRAKVWDRDLRITVWDIPDNADRATLDPASLDRASAILLGGARLQATGWWTRLDSARSDFLERLKPAGKCFDDAIQAWYSSFERRVLLAELPAGVDIQDGDQLPAGPDLSPYWTRTVAGKSNILGIEHQITQVSSTLVRIPDEPGNETGRILAEFLVGADLAPRSWFRPARDDAPPTNIERVFDGRRHFTRCSDGQWQVNDPHLDPIAWNKIAAPLVIDSTPPIRRRWKLNDPVPGGPVADWVAHDRQEVIAMLEELIAVVRERGAVAMKWTPASELPMFLFRITDDDQYGA